MDKKLNQCTICGIATDKLAEYAQLVEDDRPPEFRLHLRHKTPVCGDCGTCIDVWEHEDNCPQAPLPEVISLGDHSHRWMVASRGYAPGAYWAVAMVHVGGATLYRCGCPAGRRHTELSVGAERGCRHLRAVVAYENQRNRRPSMPHNPGAWCD